MQKSTIVLRYRNVSLEVYSRISRSLIVSKMILTSVEHPSDYWLLVHVKVRWNKPINNKKKKQCGVFVKRPTWVSSVRDSRKLGLMGSPAFYHCSPQPFEAHKWDNLDHSPMVAMALIQQCIEYLFARHCSRNWGCVLLSLMEFTDKKECQMAICTIKKTEHRKKMIWKEMIRKRVGDCFGFTGGWGTLRSWHLSPWQGPSLAKNRRKSKPGRRSSEHKGMGTDMSLTHSENRGKASVNEAVTLERQAKPGAYSTL